MMESWTHDEDKAAKAAYQHVLDDLAETRRVMAAILARPVRPYVESERDVLQREHCQHAAEVDAEMERLAEEEEENDEPVEEND